MSVRANDVGPADVGLKPDVCVEPLGGSDVGLKPDVCLTPDVRLQPDVTTPHRDPTPDVRLQPDVTSASR